MRMDLPNSAGPDWSSDPSKKELRSLIRAWFIHFTPTEWNMVQELRAEKSVSLHVSLLFSSLEITLGTHKDRSLSLWEEEMVYFLQLHKVRKIHFIIYWLPITLKFQVWTASPEAEDKMGWGDVDPAQGEPVDQIRAHRTLGASLFPRRCQCSSHFSCRVMDILFSMIS